MIPAITNLNIIAINFLTLDLIVVNFALNCRKYLSIAQGKIMKCRNAVKKLREQRMMSKAELARLAGVSAVTVDRIERGEECRLETKRKIILALGFSLSDKDKVFAD